jgi:hypothetical protein
MAQRIPLDPPSFFMPLGWQYQLLERLLMLKVVPETSRP